MMIPLSVASRHIQISSNSADKVDLNQSVCMSCMVVTNFLIKSATAISNNCLLCLRCDRPVSVVRLSRVHDVMMYVTTFTIQLHGYTS